MSAKIVLTDEDYKKIKSLAESGSNQETIAALVGGFTGRTLRNIFKEDEKALSAYKTGIAQAHSAMSKHIVDRAKESDQMAIFYAKTRMRWKENYCEEITDLSIEEMKDAKKVFEAYASGRITSEKALEILSVIEKSQLVDIEDQLKIAALEKDLKC